MNGATQAERVGQSHLESRDVEPRAQLSPILGFQIEPSLQIVQHQAVQPRRDPKP